MSKISVFLSRDSTKKLGLVRGIDLLRPLLFLTGIEPYIRHIEA